MGSNKQNILIVHNYYQIAGGEDVVVKNEMEMLKRHGHKVILYSRNNVELKQMKIINKIFLPLTTIFSVRTYYEVKKIINEQKINIVHVHNTLSLISPSVYYAALHCKVPVVQTVHNFRLLCPGATFYRDGHICEDCIQHGLKCAVKNNCYRSSKIQTLACVISTQVHRLAGIYGKLNYICLTEFNKEKLLLLKQIKAERVFVKPNCVENKKERLPYEQRKRQLVFAGRLDKLKGIDTLLNAWRVMGGNAPQLIVCGTGPMEEWCHQFVKENQLLNVELKGYISHEQVEQVIEESIALILPTQWYEGFPMSIIEAFSNGTPVLCSMIGNSGSVIKDGINGMRFEQDSLQSIVKAVQWVRKQDLVESTYQCYLTQYTEEVNLKKLEDIYQYVGDNK